jgi:hypothetical protein
MAAEAPGRAAHKPVDAANLSDRLARIEPRRSDRRGADSE